MAPSAVYPETTSELTAAAISQTLKETASSIVLNGSSSSLLELDASKLVFTPNTEPKIVPELNSPEAWSIASYVYSASHSHVLLLNTLAIDAPTT